jgi:predicted adenine nucleotide alpha hydrolase (AANH) superfamily ATPase
MKLLLHICCAPCAVFPYKSLRERDFSVTGFFYNPNIHPCREYQRRLQAVQQLQRQTGLPVIYQGDYGLEEFLRRVVFREAQRCYICYYWRLQTTAKIARQGKFDAFSSTLLYSKFQQHDLIKQIGESLAQEEGIPFYYEDFRVGWKEGIRLSKEMQLYRQQYCGCVYSEEERWNAD